MTQCTGLYEDILYFRCHMSSKYTLKGVWLHKTSIPFLVPLFTDLSNAQQRHTGQSLALNFSHIIKRVWTVQTELHWGTAFTVLIFMELAADQYIFMGTSSTEFNLNRMKYEQISFMTLCKPGFDCTLFIQLLNGTMWHSYPSSFTIPVNKYGNYKYASVLHSHLSVIVIGLVFKKLIFASPFCTELLQWISYESDKWFGCW